MNTRNPIQILVADDSVLYRRRLVALLTDIDGLEVAAEVGNAAEAIIASERLRPDVAILDLHMPGGGLAALTRITALESAPRVVMLTVFSSPRLREKCLALGAANYYDKAFELPALLELMRRLAADAPLSQSWNSGRGK